MEICWWSMWVWDKRNSDACVFGVPILWSAEEKMDEGMGWVGWEGTSIECDKRLCGSEWWSGERENEISRRSMYGKTKEWKESCRCGTFSQKKQMCPATKGLYYLNLNLHRNHRISCIILVHKI